MIFTPGLFSETNIFVEDIFEELKSRLQLKKWNFHGIFKIE